MRYQREPALFFTDRARLNSGSSSKLRALRAKDGPGACDLPEVSRRSIHLKAIFVWPG